MADFTELKQSIVALNNTHKVFGDERDPVEETPWTAKDKAGAIAPAVVGTAAMVGAVTLLSPFVASAAVCGVLISYFGYCEIDHRRRDNDGWWIGKPPRDQKAKSLDVPKPEKKKEELPKEFTDFQNLQKTLAAYKVNCAVVASDERDGAVMYELEPREIGQDGMLSNVRKIGFRTSDLASLGEDFTRDLGLPAGSKITVDQNIGKGRIGIMFTQNKSKREIEKVAGKLNVDLANDPTVGEWVKVLIGHSDAGKKPVHWYPTDTSVSSNPHMGIIGQSGKGKTQFTKSLIYQIVHSSLADNKSPIGILAFDVKNDFTDDEFLGAVNGKAYRPYHLPFNPLAIYGDAPLMPIRVAASLTSIISKNYNLGGVQVMRLKNAIDGAYKSKGIDARDNSTWKLQPPTMNDVWSVFIEQNTVIDEEGNEEVKNGDKLYSALSTIAEMEIFESDASKVQSLYEIIERDGVSVISVAGESDEIKTLVVSMTLSLFYSQMMAAGKPKPIGNFRPMQKMILIDEARSLMEKEFDHFSLLHEQAREFGVSMVIASQEITHFKPSSKNDYSAQVSTWVAFSVSDIDSNGIKRMFNVSDKTQQQKLMEKVIEMPAHHSVFIPSNKLPVQIKNKPFFEWLQ